MVELKTADLLRMSHVKRWQIVDTFRPQSVAEHSYNVAVIAMFIVDGIPDAPASLMYEVLLLSLIHDMAEVVTGDIPTPVKKILHIKDQLDRLESDMSYIGLRSDEFCPEAKRIVKQADLIEALLYLEANVDLEKENHARGVYFGIKETVVERGDNTWGLYAQICEQRKRPITMDSFAAGENSKSFEEKCEYKIRCVCCSTVMHDYAEDTGHYFCHNQDCEDHNKPQFGCPF